MKDQITEKVMSIAQRRKRAQQLRRIEPKLVRQRAVKRKRLAGEDVIYARAQKLARKMFRIKFAGQQGAHYQSLSPSQKVEIDRLIDSRGKAIKKLAMRLIPVVRMAEYKRFQALKGKHGEPTVPHLQQQQNESTKPNLTVVPPSTPKNKGEANVKRFLKALEGPGRQPPPLTVVGSHKPSNAQQKTIKDEVEILTFAEVILEDDMSKFNKLMAIGLVDKDKYLQYKKAMSDIRKNAKVAAYREMILNVLDELMDVVTKDSAIYQRVKMAVEKK